MKINIKDMFEEYIDDNDINMKNNADDLNVERIRRLTMEKINTKSKVSVMRKPVRIALIAAVISVMLIGSVSAAVYFGRVRLDSGIGEKTYDLSGEQFTYNVDTEVTFEGSEYAGNEILGFRMGYFPSFEEDAQSTIVPLKYDIAFNLEAGKIIEEKGLSSVNDIEDINDYDRIDRYANSSQLDADLEVLGVKPESLDGAYSHYVTADEAKAYAVDVYSFSKNDRKFIIEDEVEVVKTGEFDGMEATYYTLQVPLNTYHPVQYCLLLNNEADGCCITIVGSEGFEELEKIASSLEIVHTGIENAPNTDTFSGLFSNLGMG